VPIPLAGEMPMPDDFQAAPPRPSPISPARYDRFATVNFQKRENDGSTRRWASLIAFLLGGGFVAFFLAVAWTEDAAAPVKAPATELRSVLKQIDSGDKVVAIKADDKKEPTNKEKIIGIWEVTKSAAPDAPAGVTYEFTKDGKFKVAATVNGVAGGYERTYTVAGDTIHLGGEGDPKSAKIKKLTETVLVLDYGDGATDELKRKKK